MRVAPQPELDHGAGKSSAPQLAGTAIGKPLKALDRFFDGSVFQLFTRFHNRLGWRRDNWARIDTGGKPMKLCSSGAKALLDRHCRKRGQLPKGSYPQHLEGESQAGIEIWKGGKRKIGEKHGFLSALNDCDSFTSDREGGKLSGNSVRRHADPGRDACALSHGGKDGSRRRQVISPELLAASQVADRLPHFQRLNTRCVPLQDGAHPLPDGAV
jgi:hypothetical protein